jgi:hypothetical protein
MQIRLRKHRPSPAMVVALLALFVALGGIGVAATGGNFILGATNSAESPTALAVSALPDAGSCPAPCNALEVDNSSTEPNAGALGVLGNSASTPSATFKNDGGAPALDLLVQGDTAPFEVNSSKKVQGLNADLLDGYHASPIPEPSTLLPLDKDGKVPAAALPPATTGLELYRDCVPVGCEVPYDGTPVAVSLPLPAGAYFLTAKANVYNNSIPDRSTGFSSAGVECRIFAEGDFDSTLVVVGASAGAQYLTSIANDLLHTFKADDSATFACRVVDGTTRDRVLIRNWKFVALRLVAETHKSG